jgi:hypothetical protein
VTPFSLLGVEFNLLLLFIGTKHQMSDRQPQAQPNNTPNQNIRLVPVPSPVQGAFGYPQPIILQPGGQYYPGQVIQAPYPFVQVKFDQIYFIIIKFIVISSGINYTYLHIYTINLRDIRINPRNFIMVKSERSRSVFDVLFVATTTHPSTIYPTISATFSATKSCSNRSYITDSPTST